MENWPSQELHAGRLGRARELEWRRASAELSREMLAPALPLCFGVEFCQAARPRRPGSVRFQDAAPLRRPAARLRGPCAGERRGRASCRSARRSLAPGRAPAAELQGAGWRSRRTHQAARGPAWREAGLSPGWKKRARTSKTRRLCGHQHRGEAHCCHLRLPFARGTPTRPPAEWPVRLESTARPRLEQVGRCHGARTAG
jgi:hypothetical protein